VALLIFSAGPLTDARLRTLDARTLAAYAVAAALVLMVASFVLGYLSAHRTPAPTRVDGSVHFDLERPEVRALVARVGTLSSRITLLEGEAGALARRDHPAGGRLHDRHRPAPSRRSSAGSTGLLPAHCRVVGHSSRCSISRPDDELHSATKLTSTSA
jgi:hypothetical protein